ncbi:MAG: hypothetical protein ACO1SX_17910 [Actinomycetota bacterium]
MPSRIRFTSLAITGVASITLAGAAGAQLKRPAPPKPKDWRAGGEARAFASGAVRVGTDWVWGQEVDSATGVLRLNAVDNTWHEDPASEDVLHECVARVNVPKEHAEYYVKLTRLLPVGERRPTMGGVSLNQRMFGNTGIGGPGMFPKLKAYVAVWGYANVVKNKKVIARDRPALVWVGEGARDEAGKWLYEPDKSRVAAHMVIFGSLGGGSRLEGAPNGFLHFEWDTSKVIAPGFTFDPATQKTPGPTSAAS